MKEAMFLKPKDEKILVRDPISKVPLSVEGEWKDWSGTEGTFWKRRVKDGSVIISLPSLKKGKEKDVDVSVGEVYNLKGGKK